MAAPIIYEKSETVNKKKTSEIYETKLQDGGSVQLNCSSCDKPLVVLFRTRPNEKLKNGKNLEWTVKAKCCYCDDFSWVKKIQGGFHHKGYDVPHPNGNPEDVIPYVNVTNIEPDENGVVVFYTEKVK